MATATVARPAQALRNRRDVPRPTLPLKRASAMDAAAAESAGKRRKLNEPYVITKDYILKKFMDRQPSLTVHLHQTHWKFEGQEGSFAYDSPMRAFLLHLRKSTLPHDMLEELLAGNIPFYDGCLIVEVHNHRSVNGKEKGRNDSAAGDQVRYSMHNYNSYVTPSPMVPYPKKAKENEPPADEDGAKEDESTKPSEGKGKAKDGPQISTEVMFPTDLSRHKELLILANTPASEMKSKKRSVDGSTPSTAQPPTPQLAVPPALGSGSRSPGQENKMCLEEADIYSFEAEMLLATQPPLYLEPVKNPQEAQKVLDMLSHPLHNDPPPSPKTRKRTTAEMAADDAQAAEAERRMLIMDERLKAAATGDTGGAAQALGFSRFKTIQMVRENHEEQERKKKEEEALAAAQRRQQEAHEQKEKEQKQLQQERARELMNRRQHQARQLQSQQQQQAMMAQNQQNSMMANQHQNSFQHPSSVSQASPVVRQQTPMMNSSPMLPQNGFPMAATSSQQAGSPPRPTSAAMPNPAVAMARQASQQQASRNGTPQMAQGTPNMGAMQARQVSQTPRMAHGSPAPGTPAAVNISNMNITPQSGMTQEQLQILQQQQRHLQAQNQGGAMHAGSPGFQGQMTPEQFQNINNQQQQRARMQLQQQMQMIQQQQQGANPQQAALLEQRRRQLLMQNQQMMHQRMMAQQSQQNNNPAQSPHPGMQQQQGGTQQGQGLTPEQIQNRQQMQQQAMRQAQQTLAQLHQQYGGVHNIPQQIAHQLPQPVQALLRQQQQRQQAARAQQMAVRAQQAQSAGQPVAGSANADPEYMQTLRNHQAMLAQQQAQQSGQGGQMGGMSMTHNMNFNNMQNQQFGGQGQGNDLSAQFQAMQAALNRGQNQGGGQH